MADADQNKGRLGSEFQPATEGQILDTLTAAVAALALTIEEPELKKGLEQSVGNLQSIKAKRSAELN